MLTPAGVRPGPTSPRLGRAASRERLPHRRVLLLAALLAALLLAMLAAPRPVSAEGPFEAGQQVVVSADGDCLHLRAGATTRASVITCVPDGTVLTAVGARRSGAGYQWERVNYNGRLGWMADEYLVPFQVEDDTDGGAGDDTAEDTDDPEPPVPQAPTVLTAPPRGGFTSGPIGATDLDAFVEAQSFDVAVIWFFRLGTQDYVSYIPGAPAFVNTLDSSTLAPDSVVVVSRAGGEAGETIEPPAATDDPVAGAANVLPSPPAQGMTIGVSGTNDPATLAAAQPFEVRAIITLDVPSQLWLTYVPGGPDIVQTLGRGQLQPDSVVWIRAGAVDDVIETVEAKITYYYCTRGTVAPIGDGGGWCGAMANGEVGHQGAAACDRSRLGERFRIVGDPLGLTYECKDTGGGVHGHHRDIWFDLNDDGHRWILEVGDWSPGVGYTAQIEILSQ